MFSKVAPSKTAPSPPTSSFLATGGRDKLIKLWDGVSGQCLRTLSGHDNWVRALAFHPNGQHLISASDDKTIRVWDLKSGRCAKTIDAHSHFVTCLSWGRQLIKSATQAPPSSGEGLTNGSSSVNSPNGGARAADEASMRPINVIATGSVDQVSFGHTSVFCSKQANRRVQHRVLRSGCHRFAHL